MSTIKQDAETPQEFILDDCWNRIGVWGNEKPRCPKLEQVVHCANCTIYSNAGRLLLDRSADQEYLENWSAQLKEVMRKSEHDTLSILVFRIGNEWLALSTRLFHEVVEMRVIHRVPHSKSSIIKGLVNVRGELLLYISLGSLLGVEKGPAWDAEVSKTKYVRLVVISVEDIRFAFPVTEILGIRRYTYEDMQNVPATAGHGSANYLQGLLVMENLHIGCIDENLMLNALRRTLA